MRECQLVVLKTMKTCSIPCLDYINPRHSCMKLKKHRKLFGINLCKSLSMMLCIMHPRTNILLLQWSLLQNKSLQNGIFADKLLFMENI
jgi:hypothetical protein